MQVNLVHGLEDNIKFKSILYKVSKGFQLGAFQAFACT